MSKKVSDMSLKEYVDFHMLDLDNYDIAALETYIELKLKTQEANLIKPYLTNIRGDKLYPNQLEPFKVTCDTDKSGLFPDGVLTKRE